MNGIAVKCDQCGKIEFMGQDKIVDRDVPVSWIIPDGWYKLSCFNRGDLTQCCSKECVTSALEGM